jgi:nucleoside-diphosphate-sugar epimerase
LAAYRSTNVNATIALANAAAARRVKRFIFLSSIKAVNESSAPGRPLRPEDPPSPSDPYGISKLEAERALLAVGARNGLEIVIVRPPLVYGPGVRANFLSMSRWIALGIPLPLGGLTENRRSFVALDNLLDLIVRCLWHPASPFTTFHVSDGEDLSTAELLRRTALAMGRSPRLLPVPVTWLARGASLLRQSDRWRRLGGTLQVDITQTRERLGWTPTVSIEEGLRRAVGGSARPSVCR